MDAYMAKAAIELAVDEDKDFAAALAKVSKLEIEESEDGTITLTADDQSVEIDAEELMEHAEEEREEDKPSSLPPPPAGALSGVYGAVAKPGALPK